jgi:hypothetical protein
MNLIQEYNRYYSSDGLIPPKTATSGKRFTSYTVQNGIKDSLTYTFKYNNSIKLVTIKRYKEDSIKNRNPRPTRVTALDRKKSRDRRRKSEWI